MKNPDNSPNLDGIFDPTYWTPGHIVSHEVGAGLSYLQGRYPSANLDPAIWAGSANAVGVFNDPTYLGDYKIDIGSPNSRHCQAITAGFVFGASAAVRELASELLRGNTSNLGTAGFGTNFDWGTLDACLPSQKLPYFYLGPPSTGLNQDLGKSSGSLGIPALARSPLSAPGSSFGWLQPDLLDKVGGLAPGGPVGPAQANVADTGGAIAAAPPQNQMTSQPFAPPPPPFGVPVPPALLPLVPHFFPQGFDAGGTQPWPSAGTSNDAGTQPSSGGSTGAGLGLTVAQPTPQPFAAPPASHFGVPIPEALERLVPFFFP